MHIHKCFFLAVVCPECVCGVEGGREIRYSYSFQQVISVFCLKNKGLLLDSGEEGKQIFFLFFFSNYIRLVTSISKSKGLETLEEALLVVGAQCPAHTFTLVLLSLF